MNLNLCPPLAYPAQNRELRCYHLFSVVILSMSMVVFTDLE